MDQCNGAAGEQKNIRGERRMQQDMYEWKQERQESVLTPRGRGPASLPSVIDVSQVTNAAVSLLPPLSLLGMLGRLLVFAVRRPLRSRRESTMFTPPVSCNCAQPFGPVCTELRGIKCIDDF